MEYNYFRVFYSLDRDSSYSNSKPKLEFKLRPIEDVKRDLSELAKTVEARVKSIQEAKKISWEDLRKEITI